MPMIEEQITESIQTGAPSIKYEAGRDEVASMPDKEAELYQIFLDALKNGDLPPGTDFDAFKELVMKSMQQPQGNMQAQGMMQPQGMMQDPRATAAYGGIMGLDNRKRYGLGSSLKKFVRKIIPNEISDIAVKAAPFVAPFNPAVAGLMAGIGGFDQHGSIGKGLKSGLMNYGLGQGARYLGGADFQKGNPFGAGGAFTGSGFRGGFSSPIGTETGLGKFFSNRGTGDVQSIGTGTTGDVNIAEQAVNANKGSVEKAVTNIAENTKDVTGIKEVMDNLINSTAAKIILTTAVATGLYTAKTDETPDLNKLARGMKMDVGGIQDEVQAALAGGEEAWAELQKKYPYLGEYDTKLRAAHGGRIRAQEGGLMDLGGMEKDYRDDGGFVPLGGEEKADDVPARLSKNEFVFTADAVRGAGDGDVDLGAEKLGGLMAVLEEKGKNSGAEEMFSVSERIGEVI